MAGHPGQPAQPARTQAAPAQAEPVEMPGDAVCWLRLVCPECGAMAEGDPASTCPQCGAQLDTGR
jgi:rubrerythrin